MLWDTGTAAFYALVKTETFGVCPPKMAVYWRFLAFADELGSWAEVGRFAKYARSQAFHPTRECLPSLKASIRASKQLLNVREQIFLNILLLCEVEGLLRW